MTSITTPLTKDSVALALCAISLRSTLFPYLLSLRVSIKTLTAPSLKRGSIVVLLERRICEGKNQHTESEDVE